MIAFLAAVVVLMYHRVDAAVPSNPVGRSLTVAPQRFAEELDAIARAHLTTSTVEEVADALARRERPSAVVLTFDDGSADNYTVAFPLLRSHGMRATFYVNSTTIDAPLHMTWAHLREMRAEGMEIGCHSAQHVDLGILTAAQQRSQIADCAASIAKHVGARPRTFAYPSGDYTATTVGLLRELGFAAAVTENAGIVRPGVPPEEWPRERVERDTSVATFEALIAPAYAERREDREEPQ
ncbi:MAG TPA: polysaccharide deacetylase family protein [Candidatus Acidoferrum sp.]|nr:polysaccharide deacetylase family protein [Candidatus Acidoferrum sp.]